MFRRPALRRTLDASLRDVTSRNDADRVAAIKDLVHHETIARPRVVTALAGALTDVSPVVRAAAAVALSDIQAIEALPQLLVAVEDEDSYVRQMALSAIGELGDSRSGERLRRALSDPRPEVRFQAIIAFTRVVPEEGLAAVLHALDDVDPAIRHIALRCAEELTLGQGVSLGDELLARTCELVDDEDATVRVAAAVILSRLGNRAGLTVLLDVVRGLVVTTDPEDEAAAVEIMGEFAVDTAIPHLERRAFHLPGFSENKFAWQALVSLARLGSARAKGRILRDLRSWSRDRRTFAVAAAGRARLAEARALILAMRGDETRAEAAAVEAALEQLAPGEGAIPESAPSRLTLEESAS